MNVPAASHKHVVIVGATGMVGGYALRYALENSAVGVERAEKLFGSLSPEQLEQELAPGKNRLIYLWGHLAAVNDRLLPLLGIGERLHPEFDGMFISNPVSEQSLKTAWQEINQKLWEGFSKFSARIGRSGILLWRNRISSGNRIGIDSGCCSEEPRTLPIAWGKRHWCY